MLKLIRRTDGQHFKTGLVHTRTSTSREYQPNFQAEEFDDETNKIICELHLAAADVSQWMADIHLNIAILKSKLSAKHFLEIVSSVGLPLTTVSIVDPAPQVGNIDSLHVRSKSFA